MRMTPTCNDMRIVFLLVIIASTHHISLALSIGRRLQTTTSRTPTIPSSLHASGHPNNGECTNSNSPLDTPTSDLPSSRRRVIHSLTTPFLTAPLLAILTTLPSTANASTYRDPKTGILLPSVGEIESSIPLKWEENDNPLFGNDSSSFSRLDSKPDDIFYSEPRFVEHVDEQAVASMTSYISDRLLTSGDSVLDLCSSWTSHIRPLSYDGNKLELKRVAGLGMNAKELEANKSLTEWTVLDLNADTNVKLPYDDESFDVIVLQLSIDYLIHPLQVMKEASRVLRTNGKIAILISNRLFLSKAVGLWTGSDDIDHAYTVGSYLRFSEGGFENIKAEDLSSRKQKGKERVIVGDPLYVVTATKG